MVKDEDIAVLAATVDIAILMSLISFAKLNLSDDLIDDFFQMCSNRLIAQNIDSTIIDKTIKTIRNSIDIISKELNAKDKY